MNWFRERLESKKNPDGSKERDGNVRVIANIKYDPVRDSWGLNGRRAMAAIDTALRENLDMPANREEREVGIFLAFSFTSYDMSYTTSYSRFS